jgi:hypothetical protein
MKDLRAYMRDDGNYIEKFENACSDMAHSRYILAESKISALLQTVAGDISLYELFKSVMTDFDFSFELNKSKIPDGYNTHKIVLPHSKRKVAAYVFSLLYAFDTHAMSLKDFLHEFFYTAAGANAEYEQFVRQIIVPFKNSVVDIINGDEDRESIEEPFFEKDDPELDTGAVETAVMIVGDMIAAIQDSPDVNANEREELLLVCEGLRNTVGTKNKKLILILFIGCRNTVRVSKLSKALWPQIELLEQRFRENGILF